MSRVGAREQARVHDVSGSPAQQRPAHPHACATSQAAPHQPAHPRSSGRRAHTSHTPTPVQHPRQRPTSRLTRAAAAGAPTRHTPPRLCTILGSAPPARLCSIPGSGAPCASVGSWGVRPPPVARPRQQAAPRPARAWPACIRAHTHPGFGSVGTSSSGPESTLELDFAWLAALAALPSTWSARAPGAGAQGGPHARSGAEPAPPTHRHAAGRGRDGVPLLLHLARLLRHVLRLLVQGQEVPVAQHVPAGVRVRGAGGWQVGG